MTIEEMIQANIDTIDPELYDLLTYMNRVQGITTTGSCFGHNRQECFIFGEAKDISTLQKFMRDYFYCNELWDIKLYITDVLIDDNKWGEVLFCISSNPKYIDFPTLQLLVSNLTMTFKLRQSLPEYSNKLLLEIDNSVTLEDAIREVIIKESEE